MAEHVYGVDLGTSNIKMFSLANNGTINEKNVIAIKIKMKFSALVTQHSRCMRKHRQI